MLLFKIACCASEVSEFEGTGWGLLGFEMVAPGVWVRGLGFSSFFLRDTSGEIWAWCRFFATKESELQRCGALTFGDG